MSEIPSQIGPYQILREIGRGGMGVVYLARDTQLDRDIAIKGLPEDIAADADDLARFEREAKTLASVNHPNVAAIYGLEEVDGQRYLVLEYVEGEGLDERIERGPLPVEEALPLAIQIALGVESAHEKSIVHRDLKPGNIRITPDGQVKVLDFGLAKDVVEKPSSGEVSRTSPTVTGAVSPASPGSPTLPGVILGTAGYLSPEQARGIPVDTRTDVFSFGCILYEMLTGDAPFRGDTIAESIAATLRKEVSYERLPAETPPLARHVLKRCLERDHGRRLRDIGDARIDLEVSQNGDALVAAAPPVPNRRRSNSVPAVVALLLVAIGVYLGSQLSSPAPEGATFLSVEPPPGTRIRFSGDLAGPVAVSPDGSTITFAASRPGEPQRLWIKRLAEPATEELAGTEGAIFPFWSPDGESIAFFTNEALHRIHLVTKTVTTVCEELDAPRGGAWTDDGHMVIASAFRGGLSKVPVSGGSPETLTTVDFTQHSTHRWPSPLPGGRFLFLAMNHNPLERKESGIYIGATDGSPPRKLVSCEVGAVFVDDWLLFVRDNVLLASRVDLDAATLRGELKVISREVYADLATWHPQFSVSAGELLAFHRIAPVEGGDRSGGADPVATHEGDQLTTFDREGRPTTHYAEGVPNAGSALSADGLTIAVCVVSADGTTDIWLYPTAWTADPNVPHPNEGAAVMDPEPTRLTFLKGSEGRPVWSPDGKEVAFAWRHGAGEEAGMYRKRLGGGKEELILQTPEKGTIFPVDWTPEYLIYVQGMSLMSSDEDDIWAYPLAGGDPIPLVRSPRSDNNGVVSPNGRWLAYDSNESGQMEVYVIPFAPERPGGADERRWRISVDGGRMPRWIPAGGELYYISTSGSLMAVELKESDDTLEFSSPAPLFQSPWDIGSSYDVFPKGTRFLFTDTRVSANTPVSLILNWQALLTREETP